MSQLNDVKLACNLYSIEIGCTFTARWRNMMVHSSELLSILLLACLKVCFGSEIGLNCLNNLASRFFQDVNSTVEMRFL